MQSGDTSTHVYFRKKISIMKTSISQGIIYYFSWASSFSLFEESVQLAAKWWRIYLSYYSDYLKWEECDDNSRSTALKIWPLNEQTLPLLWERNEFSKKSRAQIIVHIWLCKIRGQTFLQDSKQVWFLRGCCTLCFLLGPSLCHAFVFISSPDITTIYTY